MLNDDKQPEIQNSDQPANISEPPLPTPPPAELPLPTRRRWRWGLLFLLVMALSAGILYRNRLTALIAKNAEQSVAPSERKILYWVDPMHPSYKAYQPGKAPDCGMDLTPVYEEPVEANNSVPADAIQINPERQQLIGVQSAEATYQSVAKTLRAVGRLAYDETKITRVHPRIEGWIEQVFVDFTGKQVNKGQPLISLYSPEIWQTQQEYLLALKGRNELAKSQFREAVASSESLLQAARKRLELWDIEMSQLEHLEHTGQPFKALTLNAPTSGFVLARNAYPKQRVTPETELYAIADLSTIWVLADIYEYEAPEIKVGQTARVTFAYEGSRVYRGKVTYIYPQLDNATRTLKARIEVPNPDFKLKPDMYANVEISIDYGRRLVVPQEAVLDSGTEQTIFIARDGGYFEPRKVQLGAKVDNNVIILSGLKAGERVVTSANFLIDSESKLKAATSGMGMPGMNHGASPAKEVSQTKVEDHSQHQPKPTATPSAKPEDHSEHQPNSAQKVLYWTCTMHPEVHADKPGNCPKCGMKLVPQFANKQ